MKKKKYRISLGDLQNQDGVTRLYHDGHTKQDVLNAIHKTSDQHSYDHKTRTDQRLMVQNLFDRSKQE